MSFCDLGVTQMGQRRKENRCSVAGDGVERGGHVISHEDLMGHKPELAHPGPQAGFQFWNGFINRGAGQNGDAFKRVDLVFDFSVKAPG